MTDAPKISNRELEKQISFFKDFLEKNGYYYNISRLYTLPKYDEKYAASKIKKYWENFIRANKGQEVLGNINFYVHTPFCRSRCEYCSFPSWELKDEKKLDEYVEYLIENFRFFRKTFSKIKFRNIYFGGGTPNILSSAQMEKLFSALFRNFNFVDDPKERIWTYEFNSSVGELSKISLLRKFGFNRISFGVQSFSEKILLFNRRDSQKYETVKKAIETAKKNKFDIVNADLIAGFSTDTPRTFADSFLKLVNLRPTTITVYGLYPPSDKYLASHFKMNYPQYFKTYYPKKIPKLLKKAYDIAGKNGYDARPFGSMDFFWQFNDIRQLKKFNPRKSRGREYGGEFSSSSPSSTFGLGPFSRSYLRGTLEYQQSASQSKFDPEIKIYSGRKLSANDEMLRFVISSMEHGNILRPREFSGIFGKEIIDVFPHAMNALKKKKKMREKKGVFELSFKDSGEKFIFASFFAYESMAKK